ncbi:hypothetical protein CRYUN_Cryun40dG0082400 [Craigia yunnanensis]
MQRSMGTIIMLLLGFFTLATINITFTSGSSDNIGCIESEKQALLMFKQHLVDPANRLASWIHDEDCCRWDGVFCDNVTGHVLQLQLRHPTLDVEATDFEYSANERIKLGGKINNALLNLKHLSYLDLSNNNFEGNEIPRFFGSMGSLRYLNLSHSEFGGLIPSQLGNLSNLQYLNLNCRGYSEKLFVENLQWLGGLSQLKHLDLNGVDLSEASDWLHMVTTLHSLEELHLSFCQIPLVSPNLNLNLSSLVILDLSSNFGRYSSNLSWVYSLKTLVSLDLGDTGLKGPIPHDLSNLTSLRYLDLSGNSFSSSIPDWLYGFSPLESLCLSDATLHGKISSAIGNMTSVINLDLSNNKLSGNLPKSFGQLKNLEILDISHNLFEGDVYEIQFTNLTNLRHFHGSRNSLNLQVNPNWIPPFQLESIRLGSWNLGPKFPPWLHSKTQVKVLDISDSGISDSIPSWFWQMSSQFYYLNISHNQILGQIPAIPVIYPRAIFDFNSNSFKGLLPRISFNLMALDLSNNYLSDSLSNFLCMNETMNLEALNLGGNRLFGEIPNCWMKWQYLSIIVLSTNNFTGFLPPSLGALRFLQTLHLANNRLLGELTPQLKNCQQLRTLDLHGNELKGQIPALLGLSLQNLIILSVASNKFHGSIPNELCALRSLQVLDLSHNNLSGYIPKCIGNFSAMFKRDDSILKGLTFTYYGVMFFDYIYLVMKGKKVEYSRTLSFVKCIDLSDNNLHGGTPDEITRLQGLQSLNLSHNHLIGSIPGSIGAMESVESIDFSMNQLFGSIPQSISNLTFLSYLNLSNNNLIGRIPSSTQLHGFDASSFTGNRLCGPPITQNCSVNGEIPITRNEGKKDDGNGLQVDWFYVMMAIGFAAGFGAVLVPLMLSRWWRWLYFQFLDQMWTRLVLLYAKAT